MTSFPIEKKQKPEVATEIQDGRRRHLGFYIECCHFVANWPIFTKFWQDLCLNVLQTVNIKLEVQREIQDGGGGHLGFSKNSYTSAIYEQIFMKF